VFSFKVKKLIILGVSCNLRVLKKMFGCQKDPIWFIFSSQLFIKMASFSAKKENVWLSEKKNTIWFIFLPNFLLKKWAINVRMSFKFSLFVSQKGKCLVSEKKKHNMVHFSSQLFIKNVGDKCTYVLYAPTKG